jgi:hypothetical protein
MTEELIRRVRHEISEIDRLYPELPEFPRRIGVLLLDVLVALEKGDMEIARLREALEQVHNLALLPFDDNKRRAIAITCRAALAEPESREEQE